MLGFKGQETLIISLESSEADVCFGYRTDMCREMSKCLTDSQDCLLFATRTFCMSDQMHDLASGKDTGLRNQVLHGVCRTKCSRLYTMIGGPQTCLALLLPTGTRVTFVSTIPWMSAHFERLRMDAMRWII